MVGWWSADYLPTTFLWCSLFTITKSIINNSQEKPPIVVLALNSFSSLGTLPPSKKQTNKQSKAKQTTNKTKQDKTRQNLETRLLFCQLKMLMLAENLMLLADRNITKIQWSLC